MARRNNVLLDTSLNISSFGEDEAGEVYVVGLGGTVSRLASSDAAVHVFNLADAREFPEHRRDRDGGRHCPAGLRMDGSERCVVDYRHGRSEREWERDRELLGRVVTRAARVRGTERSRLPARRLR